MTRARRSLPSDGQPIAVAGTSSSVNRLLVLLVVVLGVSCANFLREWRPVDRHNIGNVLADTYLSYGPIDVVYTWVNGTDPRWKAEKEFWHKHWIASLTGQPLPKRNAAEEEKNKIKGKDDSNADNRFRDNEELRYSLRSLEKYAPWVRQIYVVTDGQIPSWLNIESPKIQIVKHADIFANKSHLPVFSSPAIEWNLDGIPALSETFLYFNDDVFLGSYVAPEDFISQTGVQKAYFAWEAPLCAEGCWESWLGNGRCDKLCNVTGCDFDMGDCGCDVSEDGEVTCDAAKIASIQDAQPKPPKLGDHICLGPCMYRWLGDGHCQHACNISSCGFDGGDCGVTLLEDLYSAEIKHNDTLVQVPLEINSTYLNLTDVFGVNGSIVSASHDNDDLVRYASVYETEMLLLLVFGRDDEGHPMTNSAEFTVEGTDMNGTYISVDFSLVRGHKMMKLETSTANDSSGFSTFHNTSIRPKNIRLPFGFRQATFQSVSQEMKAEVADHEVTLHEEMPLIEIFLPFNVTGKQLKDGEILTLGMDLTLRLHEEQDQDWSDYQSCIVRLPPKAKDTKNDGVISEQIQSSSDKPVDVIVDSNAHTEVSVGDIDSLDYVNGEEGKKPSSTFSFDLLNENDKDDVVGTMIVEDAKETEVEPNQIPFCHLVGSEGITVTISIPTFRTIEWEEEHERESSDPSNVNLDCDAGDETCIAEAKRASKVEGVIEKTQSEEHKEGDNVPVGEISGLYEAVDESHNYSTASDEHMDSSSLDNTAVSTLFNSPQVADGKLCFFDAEVDNPKRYCFVLAMGHFFPHRQVVVHKPTLIALQNPPKPEIVYEPYTGGNPALLELEWTCVDATLRMVGMRPRICKKSEVPVWDSVDEEDEEQKAAALKVENEREGRRIACEAKKRRLALREEFLQEEEARRAAGGLIFTTQEWMHKAVERLKSFAGVDTVEETDQDVDHIEYEDVCAEFIAVEIPPPISEENAQALLSKDTFGDSLRFVNKLYNRAFGKASERRRVPSHMPFLLKKQIIREMKERWPKEYEATSSHRFRHPQDMQFSFSYFHYLINRHKVHPPTIQQIWHEYLDVNCNGILDENEVLTVASLAYGNYPPDKYVKEVKECLQPPKQEKVREHSTAKGTMRVSESLSPHITLEHLESCPDIVEKLLKNVRKEKLYEIMPEDEVTFHMLSDNYRFAWNQMMGTRARRTKFVCINDDMKFPSKSVNQILHELFLSIWPKRSQFELPYHLKNRYDHIDDYNAARERRQLYTAIGVAAVLLLMFFFRSELKALFGFQDIARARAASASQLSADLHREESMEEEAESVELLKDK